MYAKKPNDDPKPYLSSPPLHNRELLLRQPIQLLDQRVYLPVGGIDPPLQGRLLVRRADQGELFMQREHLFHLGDQTQALSVQSRAVSWYPYI